MLVRTALYALAVQLLLSVVIAVVIPHGAAWLTTAGFVTPYYDHNVFAIKLVPVPWTDPRVYISVQTLVQMLALSMTVSALVTLARTNPWHHGAPPESTPPVKDAAPRPAAKRGGDGAGSAPAAAPPAPATPPS